MESRQSLTADPLREPTRAELRALAHPLRLRILRLCLDRPRTNRELADRLKQDPGTVLHHVRTLVRNGFLAAEPVRTGKRGAVERPYRATGKSWTLRVGGGATATSAVEAFRDELAEAGDDALIGFVRLGVRLTAADRAELKRRLQGLGDEFAGRGDPLGQPVGILLAAHRRLGD